MSVYVNLPNGEHAQRVVMAGAETGQGDVPVSSNGILPVEIQSRLASTIQTHSGVSVTPSGSSSSAWIDTDGFDKLVVHMSNDASTTSYAYVEWSTDQSTVASSESVVSSNTTQKKSAITDTKLRYARVGLVNSDAAPHTMSAWAYLKV